jgi:hypothetical protein
MSYLTIAAAALAARPVIRESPAKNYVFRPVQMSSLTIEAALAARHVGSEPTEDEVACPVQMSSLTIALSALNEAGVEPHDEVRAMPVQRVALATVAR